MKLVRRFQIIRHLRAEKFSVVALVRSKEGRNGDEEVGEINTAECVGLNMGAVTCHRERLISVTEIIDEPLVSGIRRLLWMHRQSA